MCRHNVAESTGSPNGRCRMKFIARVTTGSASSTRPVDSRTVIPGGPIMIRVSAATTLPSIIPCNNSAAACPIRFPGKRMLLNAGVVVWQ